MGVGGGSGWLFQPLPVGTSQRSLGGQSAMSGGAEGASRSGSRRQLAGQFNEAATAASSSTGGPSEQRAPDLGSRDADAIDMHHAVGLSSQAGSSVASLSERRGSDALSQRSAARSSAPRRRSSGFMPQWFFADLVVT